MAAELRCILVFGTHARFQSGDLDLPLEPPCSQSSLLHRPRVLLFQFLVQSHVLVDAQRLPPGVARDELQFGIGCADGLQCGVWIGHDVLAACRERKIEELLNPESEDLAWANRRGINGIQENLQRSLAKHIIDRLLPSLDRISQDKPRELGPEAAQAASVYLMTNDDRYLDLACKCLRTSIEFQEACYRERKSVNWYATSRVHRPGCH